LTTIWLEITHFCPLDKNIQFLTFFCRLLTRSKARLALHRLHPVLFMNRVSQVASEWDYVCNNESQAWECTHSTSLPLDIGSTAALDTTGSLLLATLEQQLELYLNIVTLVC
uniref:Uncharacterized protein n=1 Tax=Monopterus albus TaxID=43700 RepID=A0A3Q3QC54_MONAL